MKKTLHLIDSYFEECILSIIVAFFVIATSLQVVSRLVLKIPMPWTEETARYALIWMTFLGSSFAAKRGTHIRVDILETMIKKHGIIVKYISFAIFLIFTITMTVVGVQICSKLIAMPQYSTVLHIPMFYIYLALPVGMGLTSFRIIQKLYRDVKGGNRK